jgi:uncharacterized membrane protein YphA (DoxX/SURF4 family)
VKQWAALLARLVVGGVWLWAGLAKLTDPLGSVQAVAAYDLLPRALVEPIGYALPPVEVVVGLALIAGVMTRGAALISALLFVAFIIGIASAWARGLEIDCGCFGGGGYDPDAASKYPWEIARDVGLLLASAFVVWAGAGRLALDSVIFRRHTRDDQHVHDLEGV